ncbi:hypothetical protein PFICI_06193 [Pestalotiopsis fici W106-1]|uniref:Uncharacterized protein n=1 Tax=Pestalotiopsis fici (strain W106-1 / CGMCC3.15140) TaxID=1229662 RepID=W3X7P3_PESFW|nr:uncharacterized protein PFICI_06193 [Pestalotiopsis fici W106-1]ETS81191.1 hypothetical protein PFICI_06193 [Pestalotiopsis fici W106-1]
MTKNQPRPEDISGDDFQDLLNKYPALIESISTTKAGQKTLSELDEFRYEKAPEQFRSQSPKRTMTHDDVKTLVDWKLRHGKFRPTLMKLVSSNDGGTVADTIQQAMGAYWDEGQDASAALAAICKLKGIGPATASLLLSVHDPERVIFFSDEAFWWLCCSGQKAPIKYNPKEYAELNQAAQALVQRLNVSATAVEKVAYVIMKDEALPLTAVEKPKVTKKAPSGKTPAESKTVDEVGSRRSSTKRKKEPRRDSPERPVRRSKRGKET